MHVLNILWTKMLMLAELSPNSFVPRQVYTPSIAEEVNATDESVRNAVVGDSSMLYKSLRSSTVGKSISPREKMDGTAEQMNNRNEFAIV